MIDLNKAKKFYKQYISTYNIKQPRIALKVAHIYRTAERSKWLAEKLKLNKEDVLLAELIGLLHDIGRFEQVKRYNTFVDKDSINHGEYGVEILFENNLIRNFIEDNKYDEIIKKAILNHNKDKIQNITNERELIHCKIIRDADKLDISHILLNDSLETIYPFEKYLREHISEKIKQDFIKYHEINYSDRKTCADILVSHIAHIFDINYIYSLLEIKNSDYINKLIDRYEPKEKDTIQDLQEIRDITHKYINEKIEEGNICLKNY